MYTTIGAYYSFLMTVCCPLDKVRFNSSFRRLHHTRNDKPRQGLGGKMEKVLPRSEE
jgi:hypothetical protein